VLGLFSKRIATWKTSPSLKILLDMHLGNELDFKIDHKGKTFKFSCKVRPNSAMIRALANLQYRNETSFMVR